MRQEKDERKGKHSEESKGRERSQILRKLLYESFSTIKLRPDERRRKEKLQ